MIRNTSSPGTPGISRHASPEGNAPGSFLALLGSPGLGSAGSQLGSQMLGLNLALGTAGASQQTANGAQGLQLPQPVSTSPAPGLAGAYAGAAAFIPGCA